MYQSHGSYGNGTFHGFGRSTKDAEPTEKPLVMAWETHHGCGENDYIVYINMAMFQILRDPSLGIYYIYNYFDLKKHILYIYLYLKTHMNQHIPQVSWIKPDSLVKHHETTTLPKTHGWHWHPSLVDLVGGSYFDWEWSSTTFFSLFYSWSKITRRYHLKWKFQFVKKHSVSSSLQNLSRLNFFILGKPGALQNIFKHRSPREFLLALNPLFLSGL